MATERDYNVFADEAYQIDKTRAKNEDRAPLLKGDIFRRNKIIAVLYSVGSSRQQ
ncbi:hypothetical protein [Listeria booriae]|uniref:hypothetical protein n=1 Tax=Listeria booriae TaxID=1552123 RepID=UPI00164DF490|nr:hypothetical protein [Listeria booriae]MBC6152645.1 hypothetical protein [Listeria booriae]MBC6306405.1 hypothetical protein [Listeria booriae]